MSDKILFDQEDGWRSGGRIVLTDLMGLSDYFHLRVDTDHPAGAYLHEGQRKALIEALQGTVEPDPEPAVQEFNVGDRVRLIHDRDDYVDLPVGSLGTVQSGPDFEDEYNVRWYGETDLYATPDQLALVVPEVKAKDSVPALIGRIKTARDLALRMDNDAMAEGLAGVLVMLAMFGASE